MVLEGMNEEPQPPEAEPGSCSNLRETTFAQVQVQAGSGLAKPCLATKSPAFVTRELGFPPATFLLAAGQACCRDTVVVVWTLTFPMVCKGQSRGISGSLFIKHSTSAHPLLT